jgi:predicted anti-sigma-YlaC factor YlaD
MDCISARELISAAADDELAPSQRHLLDGHLDHCADCSLHADRVAGLTRLVRLRPAEPVPDLVLRVLDRARPARLGRGGWLRPALAVVAVVLGTQSISPLVFGDVAGAPTHVARHLGAFALALALGLLYAAWRPHRAFGLLPFAAALVFTTLTGAAFDVAAGSSTALAEAVHVTELIGLVLLWMIAGSPGVERVTALARSTRRASNVSTTR